MAVAALIVAIASALSSLGAVWYARRLDRTVKVLDRTAKGAAEAVSRSALASEKRTELESDRRKRELTPKFRVTVDWLYLTKNVPVLPQLKVSLLGPHELGRLDRLVLSIRDDNLWRNQQVRILATDEEFSKQIWGPYRLNKLLNSPKFEVDPTGRVISTDGMPVGESLTFPLYRTEAPPWWLFPSKWNRQVGTVLRLQLEAQRKEGETWILPCEIDTARDQTTIEIPYDHTA